MISLKTLESIEYDKIKDILSNYAVLESTKSTINGFLPVTDFKQAEYLLNKTEEAFKVLYTYNLPSIYYFDDLTEEFKRVDVGGVLSCGELLKVANNLKSARITASSFNTFSDDSIVYLKEFAKNLYVNEDFEKEITSKILSEDEISDNASPKLYSIRKEIRNINARIREQLNSYMRGNLSKYLQNAVVTMRQDRFVIPVKSEYRSFVKGFIHDQSSSGATVFIEPEHVMELNNDLKRALFDEAEEIAKILAELSARVGTMTQSLRYNMEILSEIDFCYARANYAYETKSTRPILNDKGIVDIYRGRHPLIDKDKVVPVTVSLGEKYNFLLISGPNTGGKTITLKLVGIFSLMAMSGLFLPTGEGTVISVFNDVFCDIGDGQSIEQSLSTFSSHIKNIIEITNNACEKSLVLIDEIGAGTDPEEGSPLALAIINKLISNNCYGIITTHYAQLKEFAMQNDKIENACMEFDPENLKPLYRLNIGMPGSSNAITIAKTLGLNDDIIDKAYSYMSQSALNYNNVLKRAEESRREYQLLSEELDKLKQKQQEELNLIALEKEKIAREREKIYTNAKHETKRIVADKLIEAEEIIDDLKSILKNAELESKEVFRASELKNRLKNSRYLDSDVDDSPVVLSKADVKNISVNDKVYVKSLGTYAKIIALNDKKSEADVLIGDIKTKVKYNDLFNNEKPINKDEKVKVNKKTSNLTSTPKLEINLIGKTSLEAVTEVENFIDSAILNGLEEVKIIHGVGKGILLKAIRDYLKTDKNVLEYRRGKYGEGENGVTIVKLK
ncbi:MAG: endonuclease MutS2 [Clostridia bacterium]|nr:endonuclease MutS2 [Clostridia bacterium]